MKQYRVFCLSAALALGLGLLPMPSLADTPKPVEREIPNVVQNWQARLKSAEADLKAGKYGEARSATHNLLREMSDRIESGPGAAPILALTVLFRGLAEAGLGDYGAASWDWHVAQTLHPPMAETDLTAYGKAGEVLKEAGAPLPYPVFTLDRKPPPSGKSRVERPRALSTPAPEYPKALAAACLQGAVVLESILGADGKLRLPRLVESPGGPVMAIAAFEAARSWRFQPAVLEGKPVAVYYSLTVNFKVPTCRNPAATAAQGKKKDG